MFKVKILDSKDSADLTQLLLQRPEVFNGYSDEEYKKYLAQNVPEFLNNNLFFSIGLYEKFNLIGCMIAKEFTTAPAWCWAHWVNIKSFSALEVLQLRPYFLEMDNILFEEMEVNRNLNRFHFAYRADNIGVRSLGSAERFINFVSKIHDSRFARYKFYNDGILEANQIPKYDYQKNMILNRTWPIKIGFRLCVKKEQDDN